jgi:hypothetical protein
LLNIYVGEIGTAPNRAVACRYESDTFVLLKNSDTTLSKLSSFQDILVAGQALMGLEGNAVDGQSRGLLFVTNYFSFFLKARKSCKYYYRIDKIIKKGRK